MDDSNEMIMLNTFYDALSAGDACRHLEEASIPFIVEDMGTPTQGINRFSEEPPVRLDISVNKANLGRAQEQLRTTMHLFPEQEVDDPVWMSPEGDGDEVHTQVAACDTEDDANAVRDALKEMGIWSALRHVTDAEDPSWTSLSVMVKCEDAEMALRAIERWAG